MTRFALAAIIATPLMFAGLPAQAQDEACMARFKDLVVEGNPQQGPVRLHIFQESAGQKTENYFYSLGDRSGDGMSEPIEPKGMWSLFRNKKMWFSNDGKTWKFGRVMDEASQPEAYKQTIIKDFETASNTACGEEDINGVAHEVVQGEYVNSMSQNALTRMKYWVRKDNGFISKSETSSDSAGGKFYALQYAEPWPDLKLPDPE